MTHGLQNNVCKSICSLKIYPNHVEEHPCPMPLKDSQTLLQPVDKTRQHLYY